MENTSLQKFRQLPKSDRDLLSSPQFLSVIEKLELKYHVKVAMVFIELVVGDLAIKDLAGRFPGLISPNVLNDISVELSKLLDNFNLSKSSASLKPNNTITFSYDDDEEIKKISSSLPPMPKKNDYNLIADQIIFELGYKQKMDEVMQKRFHSVVVFMLRDIRDELETLETLKKGKKIGGLELPEEEAKKITQLIKLKLSQGLVFENGEEKSGVVQEKERIVFPQRNYFEEKKAEKAIGLAEKKAGEENSVVASEVKQAHNSVSEVGSPQSLERSFAMTPKDNVIINNNKNFPILTKEGGPKDGQERSEASVDKRDQEERLALSRTGGGYQKNLTGNTPPDLKIEEEDGLPVIKSSSNSDLMIVPKKVEPKPELLIPEKPPVIPKPIQQPVQPKIEPIKPADVVSEKPVNSSVSTNLSVSKQEGLVERGYTEIEIPKPPVTQPLPQPQIVKESPIISDQAMKMSKKPTIDGVRIEPTLVGPIEELRTMTLIGFRRLGSPHQAIAKIKEKISLLEMDSYAKRLSGVEAWHQSEVNKFYRLLGQESMGQNKGIDDIITERISQNKPTLSIEEFNSVLELNRQLRF